MDEWGKTCSECGIRSGHKTSCSKAPPAPLTRLDLDLPQLREKALSEIYDIASWDMADGRIIRIHIPKNRCTTVVEAEIHLERYDPPVLRALLMSVDMNETGKVFEQLLEGNPLVQVVVERVLNHWREIEGFGAVALGWCFESNQPRLIVNINPGALV